MLPNLIPMETEKERDYWQIHMHGLWIMDTDVCRMDALDVDDDWFWFLTAVPINNCLNTNE